jgi:hypothetical protein
MTHFVKERQKWTFTGVLFKAALTQLAGIYKGKSISKLQMDIEIKQTRVLI